MNFYREAAKALRQNIQPVAFFVAIGFLLSGADSAIRLFVLQPAADSPDRTLGLALVGWQICYAAIAAAAQTIFFARIGREMDKPLWHVLTDRDAFERFYRLWLLLALLTMVYVQTLGALLSSDADAGTVVLFLASVFTLATLATVFGANVMFYGGAGRQEVREAFSTLGRHVAVIVAICLFGILVGLLLHDLSVSSAELGRAPGHAAAWYQTAGALALGMLAGALDSLASCFIFAYAWILCIFDRDHYEHPADDFDF